MRLVMQAMLASIQENPFICKVKPMSSELGERQGCQDFDDYSVLVV